MKPTFTVVGGPNGSGKTTLTRLAHAQLGAGPILDPDAEARRLDSDQPARARIAAGRRVLARARVLLESGRSFAVETTLSGHTYFRLIENARERGFLTRLFFVATDDVEINIERIRKRVADGGHSVPDADVARRYRRSLINLQRILPTFDEALMYDNSDERAHRLFAVARRGVVEVVDCEPPWWKASRSWSAD